jgi:hypothetical protein
MPAHELRVETLAELGRLEDAKAACDDPVWGEERPIEMTLLSAWVTMPGATCLAQKRTSLLPPMPCTDDGGNRAYIVLPSLAAGCFRFGCVAGSCGYVCRRDCSCPNAD